MECSIHLRRRSAGASELVVDESLVKQIAEKAGSIAAALPDAGPVDPLDVLRWPGVVVAPDVDADPLFADPALLVEAVIRGLAREEGADR